MVDLGVGFVAAPVANAAGLGGGHSIALGADVPFAGFVVRAWGDRNWQGLLTSLVGLLIGGGIIWAVRNVGTLVLEREAMGFGDVTLMAMIGTFLGWQPCLIVFFVAPFFALAFGVVQLVVHRDAEIPYGPFLCMATMLIVLSWRTVWEGVANVFALGWLIGAVMIGLLVVLAGLLMLIRVIRELFSSAPAE